jgi:hypothetical protein
VRAFFKTPNLTSSAQLTSSIESSLAEIRIAGKTMYVPSGEICGRTVVVTGKWLRRAAIKDENVVEGEIVENPHLFLEQLKCSQLRTDLFSFSQKISDTKPKYSYAFAWDNWAVIPTTNYNDWWEKRLPHETRKNVRRAAKRGVVVKPTQFDDEFVRGIVRIYNETPVRRGKRFWHFGKNFETVRMENATYLERSEFLGAYLHDELIGFIKIIYVDQTATLIHIISKIEHRDKKPTNALLAKAVEVCETKRVKFLLYGKFVYDRNESSPLTEFKRRNGFEEIRYPRYIIPLTAKGALALRLNIHRGARRLIPPPVLLRLKSLRSRFYKQRYLETEPDKGGESYPIYQQHRWRHPRNFDKELDSGCPGVGSEITDPI